MIAACAGGLGYAFGSESLGLQESPSEILGWAAALGAGLISFKNRWELI